MPSERSEHHATRQALVEVYDYISPGTNEGISFLVSRLTDDMFTDSFLGGWHWASALTAVVEGVLATTLSVWVLGQAQRYQPRSDPGPLARAAYPAYLVQGHILVGLALLMRPVAVPAEVKASVVSVCGVVLSFGVGDEEHLAQSAVHFFVAGHRSFSQASGIQQLQGFVPKLLEVALFVSELALRQFLLCLLQRSLLYIG